MSVNSKEGKQYGLIVPKKSQLSAPKASNVFGDDSESDGDDGTDWVKKALKAEGEKNRVKKQTQITMQRALNENPTVYQYDEVYDEMERTKVVEKTVQKKQKEPKYIKNLIKAAEHRKREQEHRIERMVQKEREAEGEMYADKESFVTSAYRVKLEEFKKMEEEESRMERLEAIGDVTKQQNLSGFYRHMLEQTVNHGRDETNVGDNMIKIATKDPTVTKENESNNDRDDSSNSDSAVESAISDKEDKAKGIKEARKSLENIKKKRQYRKRVTEDSESDNDADEIAKSNVDKESVDGLSPVRKETSQDLLDAKKQKLISETIEEVRKENINKDEQSIAGLNGGKTSESNCNGSPKQKKKDEEDSEKIEEPKRSIWEKRTVGPLYEAALERYYARKAIRLSS